MTPQVHPQMTPQMASQMVVPQMQKAPSNPAPIIMAGTTPDTKPEKSNGPLIIFLIGLFTGFCCPCATGYWVYEEVRYDPTTFLQLHLVMNCLSWSRAVLLCAGTLHPCLQVCSGCQGLPSCFSSCTTCCVLPRLYAPASSSQGAVLRWHAMPCERPHRAETGLILQS